MLPSASVINRLGPRPLTAQEQQALAAYMRGVKPSVAARDAGMTVAQFSDFLRDPDVAEIILKLRESIEHQLGQAVTRENLTMMLFEAHRKAGTATEEIAAIREIGKLNGLYVEQVQVQHSVSKIEQLEHLSDAELLKRAQWSLDSLTAEEAVFSD